VQALPGLVSVQQALPCSCCCGWESLYHSPQAGVYAVLCLSEQRCRGGDDGSNSSCGSVSVERSASSARTASRCFQ
jgi:hypothetical protein